MLDRYYFGKAERDRVKQQAHDLERFILNEKEKNIKKIEKLQLELKEAKNAEKYQLYGELLTANLYAVQKGMKEIEVMNYYDENSGTIVIPLDPQNPLRKTPKSILQNTKRRKMRLRSFKSKLKKQKWKFPISIHCFSK